MNQLTVSHENKIWVRSEYKIRSRLAEIGVLQPLCMKRVHNVQLQSAVGRHFTACEMWGGGERGWRGLDSGMQKREGGEGG